MRGALMHADVAQSLGKEPVNVKTLGVDLLSIAGHKLYAPKGIGALFMRRGLAVPPVVVGAGQERGVRPGTENVAFAVGLGVACRIAGQQLAESGVRLAALSALLLARLQEQVPGLTLTGDRNGRLPNTLNVLFPGVSGRRVLENCPQLMASTGSACHADSEEPSAILTAQGIARDAALGAVRLSLGRSTTREEVEAAAVHLAEAWRRTAAPATAAAE
jgi:cysteine desulfurase